MAKKLGDAMIAAAVLTFLVGIGSALFLSFDSASGVSSDYLTTQYNNLSSESKTSQLAIKSVVESSDEELTFAVDDPDQQLDERGNEGFGLLNLLSKNILTRFYKAIQGTIPEAEFIMQFMILLTLVAITVLLFRAIAGENRI